MAALTGAAATVVAVLGMVASGVDRPRLARATPPPAPAASPGAAAAGAGRSRLYVRPEHGAAVARQAGLAEPIRSVLNVTRRMSYGDWLWDEAGVPAGRVVVRVDLKRQLLSAFRGGHEIGTAVILYGAQDKASPVGTFAVLQKAARYRSITYEAAMPYMLRLTPDGVAIHGASVRRGAATHGCIGVPEPFARRLFEAVKLGDAVTILGTGKAES